jgi:hypothetical protein
VHRKQSPIGHRQNFCWNKFVFDDSIPSSVVEESSVFGVGTPSGDGAHSARVNDLEELENNNKWHVQYGQGASIRTMAI